MFVQTVKKISQAKFRIGAAVLVIGIAMALAVAPVSANGPSISGDTAVEAVPGSTATASYTVTNQGANTANVLVEFTGLSSSTTIDDVSGDISNELLGSSPPGVITTEVAPGESATVTVVYSVSQSASSGTTDSIQVSSTISASGQTLTDSTTTKVTTPTPSLNITTVSSKSVQNGSSFSLTYTVGNEIPSSSTVTALVEAPDSDRPQTISVGSISGDVSQNLVNSNPPGAITSSIAYNESAQITVTYDIVENVPVGTTTSIGVTANTSTGNYNDTASTSITVTKDPLANRFGGSDGEVGNLDILSAVQAANKGSQIGGKPVGNLDVLQLVQRANSQGA